MPGQTPPFVEEPPEVDFATVEFPSDVLSVKRLRQLFPDKFDRGRVIDGYTNFFAPFSYDEPAHLVDLNTLISEERTLADYAYQRALQIPWSDEFREECDWCVGEARKNLEGLYQSFKLADSPETARLLIKQVEEQGTQQAENLARGR